MHQLYVPFSKLAVDAVFKILDKEKSVNKYGETLVIYLEQGPADHNYGSDVIIKTNAPKCLKEKIAEDFPYEADFEIVEDDLIQAQTIEAALKISHTYAVRDMFYFNTKYGESGIARLKDEETLETVRIYLPKSIKQDIKLNRKMNKNKIVQEKMEYDSFEYSGKVKVYKYKYTFEKLD